MPMFIRACPILASLLIVASAALVFTGCGGSGAAVTPSARPAPPPLPNTADRRIVVTEARTWIGTPYQYGGDDKDGTDCSGYVHRVFERVGVSLPRTATEMYALGTSVTRSRLRAGDLVFFRNTAGRGITHVGIFLGRDQFVHASTRQGVIISLLTEEYYERHYAGARAILR